MGNFSYDLMYYHKAQGFVYNLLKDTVFDPLHDKKGCKYFCFSNFYSKECPSKKLVFDAGNSANWIISSPLKAFVEVVKEKLETKMKEKIPFCRKCSYKDYYWT